MIARLGNVLYWCGLAIASLCEIAAVVVLIIIITRKPDPEAWFAVAFFCSVWWMCVAGWAHGEVHSRWQMKAQLARIFPV
jgi:hypothetical protein